MRKFCELDNSVGFRVGAPFRLISMAESSLDKRVTSVRLTQPEPKFLLRRGAEAARKAHNLQVNGSSPFAATNFKRPLSNSQ